MKFKFKIQSYQTEAVNAVVDCFSGQLRGVKDPNQDVNNAAVQLTSEQVLRNVQSVQRSQNLYVSKSLVSSAGCPINLDIEMETGTGKTYCYIKSIFELNKRYGWSKFIIMVPSIAIREGVYRTLEITAEHFAECYQNKAQFFIYNSKRLYELERFSSDAGINVMVINTQAFATSGKDQRRIYLEQDTFQSRRPIDVISQTRPIVILDEPQKMEGKTTSRAIENFHPLLILRYSATHRTKHNEVYRLDSLDAFNKQLVKKISVRGISVHGYSGTLPYMYVEAIEVSKGSPIARIEIEMRSRSGSILRKPKRLKRGTNLFEESNGLRAYSGFTISEIDALKNCVEFVNGTMISAGEISHDISEKQLRRLQIREAIRSHLEKERQLFYLGVKVLTLFFIDSVIKYRNYDLADRKGEYARVFEEEFENIRKEFVTDSPHGNNDYLEYLCQHVAEHVHQGYFSVDKNKRFVDSKTKKDGSSDDENAYDLILRNKEKLLSLSEPTRFIFSHSALREGWDNPNVFTMCMLKQNSSQISRRQEVGRGLRISVNQHGERMDDAETVHDTNVLTVVANESYTNFVTNLQTEISESLTSRPRQANEEFFTNKRLKNERGDSLVISRDEALMLEFYLIQNGYVNHQRFIVEKYHQDRSNGNLAPLPEILERFQTQVFDLIDGVYSQDALSQVVVDGRHRKTNQLNGNFEKHEFQELWRRINRKAVYRVDFDSEELINKCIHALDEQLHVPLLRFKIDVGEQISDVTDDVLKKSKGFEVRETRSELAQLKNSSVTYDLLNEISSKTQLTRNTVSKILIGVKQETFEKFKLNPEHFFFETARLINEQISTIIVEHISYNLLSERYDTEIFTSAQIGNNLSSGVCGLKKHVFDYAIVDSMVEREFISKLESSPEVTVYSKLPRGFFIPTPVGNYNPDWAISFTFQKVNHIFFVAETKGSLSKMSLRPVEEAKVSCARKFFAELVRNSPSNTIQYDVIDSYERLISLVEPCSN